jgi:hypothetical protein
MELIGTLRTERQVVPVGADLAGVGPGGFPTGREVVLFPPFGRKTPKKVWLLWTPTERP